jgi:DNA-binding transcriptional LysR family regulator
VRPVVLELGRITDMVRFASHGLATALVPLTFAREIPAGAGPYTTLRLIDEVAVSVSAVRRSGHPSAAVRAFLAVLNAATDRRG